MEGFSSSARSRRNAPSLGQLHITPLTRDPLSPSPFADDDDDDAAALPTPHSSYISSRSLPQTPSILSRSPSRTRTRSRSGGHRRNARSMLALTSLDDAAVDATGTSSAVEHLSAGGPLTPGPYGPGGHRRSKSGRTTPGKVRVVDRDRTDFLLRTASLLVENASESKGQGWISKRNSSTSLAAINGGPEWDEWRAAAAERESAIWTAEDEFTPSWSRVGEGAGGDPLSSAAAAVLGGGVGASRRASLRQAQSLPSSRWASRRGSRGAKTPGGASTPHSGYFDAMSVEFADEADWDESSDGEDIDEGELRRLLRGRVGGFFDDIFGGWLDFRSGEDGEEEEDGEGAGDDEDDGGGGGIGGGERARRRAEADDEAAARDGLTKEQRAEVERARRKLDTAKKLKFAGIKKEDIVRVKPPADAGGPLSDVRWLLGLATRALY